jgi:hypothetical protein
MEMADVAGLVIFVGMVGAYTFILLGCLEQRLKKVGQIVEDSKYVN